MRYPIKLDDDYPCRGTDADGGTVVYPDLLAEGDRCGPAAPEDVDGGEAVFIDAEVVRKDDGLWVVALSEGDGS